MSATIALLTLHSGYSHSSLALRSIAAYCRDEPFHAGIRLHEAQLKGRLDWLLEEVVAGAPRLVGFSTYLWNIRESLHLARLLRQLLPECGIVFGGPEAGPRGEALLEAEPALDYVIDGEGEQAFRDLVRWRLYGEGEPGAISGLVRREGGRLRRNPVRPLPPEALPSPFADGIPERSLIYWETSRGCPYRCSFCTSAGERLRTLPLERIERDLDCLRRRERGTVKLLDRSFHLGTARTLELLERFLDTPPGLRFHLELNPDRLSAQVLELFASAPPGKFQFEIGLQSLEGAVLDAVSRQMDVDQGLANIHRLLQMRRHPVHLDLIAGLPGETAAQIRHNLDRVFALGPHHLQLGTLKLLPGTPLRAEAPRWGYRWNPEPPYEILAHRQLGFAELGRFKRYAELLERLWNNGLLRHSLARLVETHYGDSVSACFDALLGSAGETVATTPQGPERLFAHFLSLAEPALADDPVLGELLLWDYAGHSLPGRKTPPWLAAQLGHSARFALAGHTKRLPLLHLGAEAAARVNRWRLEPLAPGEYGLWPQKGVAGRPLYIVPAGEALD